MRLHRLHRFHRAALVTATLAGTAPLLACIPALAQSANPADQGNPGTGEPQPGGGSRHQGDHSNRHARAAAASPRLTELKPQVDPWPRLDAGATICRSLPDLQQLARLQRNRDDLPSVRPSCSIVTAMVPISIVSRVGPGATEVTIGGSQPELAWTNAWLPDRAAVSAQPAGDVAPARHEGQR